MKKALLLLVFIALAHFCNAQFMEWAKPVAISDSSHFNRNPSFTSGYTGTDMVFWEQQVDHATTRICYATLFNGEPGETMTALEIPGVHLTHPVVFNCPNNDVIFVVFFQTNEGNDIDLKYIEYHTNETFSAPVEFSALPGDDVHLSVSKTPLSGSDLIAWENSGKICLSHYSWLDQSFTTPYVLDSGGACSPVSSGSLVKYLKNNGDSTLLITTYPYFNQGNWEISQMYSTSFAGSCAALTSNTGFFFGYDAFEVRKGTDPVYIYLCDNGVYVSQTYQSAVFNYSQPALGDFLIGVKGGPYFLAYVSDSLGNNEIVAEAPMYQVPVNISQWPGNDQHPVFFTSFPGGDLARANLFWESDRQGFSTIYHCYLDYPFGSTGDKTAGIHLKIYPNPFSNVAEIVFESKGKPVITLSDMTGRIISMLKPEKSGDDLVKALWNGKNRQGIAVPAGMYVVTVSDGAKSGRGIIVRK